MIKMMMLMTIK